MASARGGSVNKMEANGEMWLQPETRRACARDRRGAAQHVGQLPGSRVQER